MREYDPVVVEEESEAEEDDDEEDDDEEDNDEEGDEPELEEEESESVKSTVSVAAVPEHEQEEKDMGSVDMQAYSLVDRTERTTMRHLYGVGEKERGSKQKEKRITSPTTA